MIYHDFSSGKDSALFETAVDGGLCRQMSDFAGCNPWYLSSAEYVVGRVVAGEDLISVQNLLRTDFYRNFLRPRGLLHRLCAVLSRDGAGMHCLCAFRAEQQEGFGDRERQDLQELLPHVALSLESHWRLQEAADITHALFALTEGEAPALLLVTAQARVIQRNRVADELLYSHTGIDVEQDRLRAANPTDQRLLQEALAHICSNGTDAAAQVVTLATASPQPPLIVVLRRTSPVFLREFNGRQPLALLSLCQRNASHDDKTCIFAQHYKLTPSQTRISSLIYSHYSLAAIAAALNISDNTVRSHLKQIFQKTEVHNQMDLVYLHGRICSGWH